MRIFVAGCSRIRLFANTAVRASSCARMRLFALPAVPRTDLNKSTHNVSMCARILRYYDSAQRSSAPPRTSGRSCGVSNGCDVWVRATCRGELRAATAFTVVFGARRTTVRNTIQHVLFLRFCNRFRTAVGLRTAPMDGGKAAMRLCARRSMPRLCVLDGLNGEMGRRR